MDFNFSDTKKAFKIIKLVQNKSIIRELKKRNILGFMLKQ